MTRSASRSTSAMLWEANRIVAPRACGIVLQLSPDPVGGVGVERGGRLVEQQQLRRIEQRLGEPDARLLPRRQLAGGAVEQLRISRRSSARKAMRSVCIGDTIETGIDGQVLPHGEPHRQVDIGALEIDPLRDLVAVPAHIGAEHPHLARGRHHEPEQHGDRRRLAGAVAAEQRHGGARRKRKTDVVDGGDPAVNLGKGLDRDGDRLGQVLRSGYSLIHGSSACCRALSELWPCGAVLNFTYERRRQ